MSSGPRRRFGDQSQVRDGLTSENSPATPIEQIVDSTLHHVDVAMACRKGVADKEGRPGGHNKRPAAEPQEVVLDLGRPVVPKGILAARPDQDAAAGVFISD